MKYMNDIGLGDVRAVYNGPEGALWELVMGHQIHIGGFNSSMDLAEKGGIGQSMKGVDICCCNGAGMRFLVRFRDVEKMIGIDATENVIRQGRSRCRIEGLSDKIKFKLADVCDSGLPGDSADFIWGEDAWCYVVDKSKLISEAARISKPKGTIAFTDWVEGKTPLTEDESRRLLTFMKFPNIADIDTYSDLLKSNNCTILAAQDTGRFAPYVDLYINMLTMQLTSDALRIINFDSELMKSLADEMAFMQQLAHQGKIIQALFVARKN